MKKTVLTQAHAHSIFRKLENCVNKKFFCEKNVKKAEKMGDIEKTQLEKDVKQRRDTSTQEVWKVSFFWLLHFLKNIYMLSDF